MALAGECGRVMRNKSGQITKLDQQIMDLTIFGMGRKKQHEALNSPMTIQS